MNLGLPQLIFCGLVLFALGTTAAKHGEEKGGKHNFFLCFAAYALEIALLYWGGFFS